MTEEKSFTYRILVNEDVIYSGKLGEVPEKFRIKIQNDLREWGSTLGKRGLNELLYSHLAWYEEMSDYCSGCGRWVEDCGEDIELCCGVCGEKPERRYIYPRDEKLDRIITCAGLISEVLIEEL